MITWSAAAASEEVFTLGEGPCWDAPRRRVLWVDIAAGTVHHGRIAGGRVIRTGSRSVDRSVGAVACSRAGEWLVAGVRALVVIGTDGDRRPGPSVLPAGSARRLNDGACDPAGAFLVGSLPLAGGSTSEVLVRVAPDGTVTVLDDDLTMSNGLAFSPDGGLLYSIDSGPGVVYVRPYDAATGKAGPRSELIRVSPGTPDGLCVDATGHLWIAVWGAGEVRRYTPDGAIVGVVEVPAPHTTSVAFVGDDLDQLLITTASADLDAGQRSRHPDSGRLFLARVGVTGVPVAPWAGVGPGR
jgi:sugar lactone lactonase YvrE